MARSRGRKEGQWNNASLRYGHHTRFHRFGLGAGHGSAPRLACGNREHAGCAEGLHAGAGPSRVPANAAGDVPNAAIARCGEGCGCSAHLPTLPVDAIRSRVTGNVALASQGASFRWPTLSPPVSPRKACLQLIPHRSVARNMRIIPKASGNKTSLAQCTKAPIDRHKQALPTSPAIGAYFGPH
jgi:hypothetical protein